MGIDSFYGIANWQFFERNFAVIPFVIYTLYALSVSSLV